MIRSHFIDAINENSSDFTTRLVYADWLEENGDESAAGWRWLCENGKTPNVCYVNNAWWMSSRSRNKSFELPGLVFNPEFPLPRSRSSSESGC